MATTLKSQFGLDIAKQIAQHISAVWGEFDARAFCAEVAQGYEELALMPRARRVAEVLAHYLPAAYPEALAIVLASIQVAKPEAKAQEMTGFFYLPHTCFVAQHGLAHFAESMQAQYILTQYFSAEFSIRPFIVRYPEPALALLARWASDENEHVRRLVSEGTRPRLPWGSRLAAFQRDPRPVLALLERLKDDPALYVRRSVANNLNDIGKDNPQALYATASAWLRGASAERAWIVQHALRSAIKRGEAGALAVLGVSPAAQLQLVTASIGPAQAQLGEVLRVALQLENRDNTRQKFVIDCQIHYVKANGQTRAKVFKLKTLHLAAGERVALSKSISLANMSTRQHYAGRHQVDVLVNGVAQPVGVFELRC
ncbi:DNA alkylation repair protein [Deefgea piscis]|uniref:DNA alkylation repair protein n=1 Tax=Deefgea piscis TaxID=2739061 RepID=A0A6M8T084_9NEIS|nr:DNA alkylation repair protein [Deefgea piscis]